VRLAETFFASEHLPDAARGAAFEGRSNAHLLGAEFAYDGLDLPLARRLVWKGLRLYPRNASARWLSLFAKTLLPRPVVRRLRERRRAARAHRI
jgi:hypothetical protein